MSASIRRNQLINGFELMKMWALMASAKRFEAGESGR
jgi:hypothetical protein